MEISNHTAQGSAVGEFQHNNSCLGSILSSSPRQVQPSQRSPQSYLPCKEPTDANDAQDVEHSRAHDGANSHIALRNEDSWNTNQHQSGCSGPAAFQGHLKVIA